MTNNFLVSLVNVAPRDYKQQIHQLEIVFHHLKQSAQQHVQFKAEYAHAYCQQQKREAVDPPEEKLQVMPAKTGRRLQEQRDQEEERRRVAIETGRLKKRTFAQGPSGTGDGPKKKRG